MIFFYCFNSPFNSEKEGASGGSYIDYSNESSGVTLKDGSEIPDKLFFTNSKYEIISRKFTGEILFG
jgi:hypothetical protein